MTAYYLLHRHDFGMDDAPVGACILYATACGLSDTELDKTWDILVSTGKARRRAPRTRITRKKIPKRRMPKATLPVGGKVKLKPWNQRRGKSLGYEAPRARRCR